MGTRFWQTQTRLVLMLRMQLKFWAGLMNLKHKLLWVGVAGAAEHYMSSTSFCVGNIQHMYTVIVMVAANGGEWQLLAGSYPPGGPEAWENCTRLCVSPGPMPGDFSSCYWLPHLSRKGEPVCIQEKVWNDELRIVVKLRNMKYHGY